MTDREMKLLHDASQIARLAMGTEVIPGVRGRPRKVIWKADEDPLAWWCLVEAIVGLANRRR
jgi:hypothetical protein